MRSKTRSGGAGRVTWNSKEWDALAVHCFLLRRLRRDLSLSKLALLAMDKFPPERRRNIREHRQVAPLLPRLDILDDAAFRALETVEGADLRWALAWLLNAPHSVHGDGVHGGTEPRGKPIETTKPLERLLDQGDILLAWRENQETTVLVSVEAESLMFDSIFNGQGRSLTAAAMNLEGTKSDEAAA